MPIYSYKCDSCSHESDILSSMVDAPSWVTICPSCGFETFRRDLDSCAPSVSSFRPYVEENFDGKPVEVSSPNQRDQLCEAHGVTYDSVSRPSSSQNDDVEISDAMVDSILEETQGGKILPKDVREACKGTDPNV